MGWVAVNWGELGWVNLWVELIGLGQSISMGWLGVNWVGLIYGLS